MNSSPSVRIREIRGFIRLLLVSMRIPPIMVVVAVALAGCLGGCHKQKPPPSVDGLTAALERSAEQTIPTPSLADEQIILPARPGETDAQTTEIVNTFAAAGATAVSRRDDKGQVASIMANVPEINVDAFKAALRHEKVTMQNGPSSPTRLIEVLIEYPAASPTP